MFPPEIKARAHYFLTKVIIYFGSHYLCKPMSGSFPILNFSHYAIEGIHEAISAQWLCSDMTYNVLGQKTTTK